MSTTQILIAGFGGQGVLFAGKLLAYKGLLADKQVSWLPSYGPEMRGGTANCSVIISDEPVGSPIVSKPDCLVAMNLPSLRKYEHDVVPGGIILVDSTLIEEKVDRDDVTTYYVPATSLANEAGFSTLANMILMGKLMQVSDCITYDGIEDAVKKVVPAKKANLIDINIQAIKTGYDFE
ncbi:MAG: 2-oxoacid:acceptor oxidoreductase family protein [Acutalibacteraceae bacterium]